MYKITDSFFGVRVVKVGESYGRTGSLVNESRPLVEFYDLRWIDKFGPDGQFVSRYYHSTLEAGRPQLDRHGLDLQGDVPSWKLTAREFTEAMAYVAGVVA